MSLQKTSVDEAPALVRPRLWHFNDLKLPTINIFRKSSSIRRARFNSFEIVGFLVNVQPGAIKTKEIFNNKGQVFFSSLKRSVDEYFEANALKKTGDWRLYLK